MIDLLLSALQKNGLVTALAVTALIVYISSLLYEITL